MATNWPRNSLTRGGELICWSGFKMLERRCDWPTGVSESARRRLLDCLGVSNVVVDVNDPRRSLLFHGVLSSCRPNGERRPSAAFGSWFHKPTPVALSGC